MERLCKCLVIILLLLGLPLGCGEAPEAIPSPHPITLVAPQKETGKLYLFASNRFLNTVYRIDLETLEVAEIDVGERPRNLDVRPDGNQVAVANERGRSISLIDAVSLKVQTVHTGEEPLDIRYSPDGAWLAVANYKNETVSLINPVTLEHYNLWVGGGPASISFDETSRVVAVACFQEGTVRLIGVETKQILAYYRLTDISELDTDARPQAVSFGPANSAGAQHLFIGLRNDDFTTEASFVYSLALLPIRVEGDNLLLGDEMQVLRGGPNPRGFIWHPDGRRVLTINHSFTDEGLGYNVDTISNLIYETAGPTGGERKTVPSPQRLSLLEPPPEIIALTPRPDFTHLPDGDPRYVYRTDGRWVEQSRYTVGRNPISAAMAPNDKLLAVANQDNDSVSLIDLTQYGVRSVSVTEKPYALAFTPSGRQVIVVHETPLMPVMTIDVETGKRRTLYESLSMNRWLD